MGESNVNRVAKNTMYMYIRMIFLMVISLYTSRVLLQQLGVDDFGIFNVVGSIIAVFANLRGLFTSSIQRFLNYEIGKGNEEKLIVIFNMSIIINIIMSVIFVFFAEGLGIWYLNNYINVPIDRLFAAKVIFQISIISAVLSMLTVPYDALIVAHEKLDFYALLSIFEGVFKLFVIYLLSIWAGDKLIFWGILLLALQIIGRVINVAFCRRHFKECRYKLIWDKPYFKSMLAFSGWYYAASTGYSLSQEGINMLLNFYGGVVVNAARGIAYQVKNALSQIVNNINTAVNPYAIKIYAQGENEKFNEVLFFTSKINVVVFSCIAFPIFLLAEPVISLWLGTVPDYSVIFIKTILVYELFHAMKPPIDRLFHAANKMKLFCIAQLVIHVLSVLVVLLFLYLKYEYYTAFLIMSFFMIVSLNVYLFVAQKELKLSYMKYIENVAVPLIFFFIILIFISCSFSYLCPKGMSLLNIIVVFIASALMTAVAGYCTLINRVEKRIIKDVISHFFKSRNEKKML